MNHGKNECPRCMKRTPKIYGDYYKYKNGRKVGKTWCCLNCGCRYDEEGNPRDGKWRE